MFTHEIYFLRQQSEFVHFNMLNTISQCMFISLKTNDSSSLQMLIFNLHIFFNVVPVHVLLAFLIRLFSHHCLLKVLCVFYKKAFFRCHFFQIYFKLVTSSDFLGICILVTKNLKVLTLNSLLAGVLSAMVLIIYYIFMCINDLKFSKNH